ncbi:MAG: ATP-binding protein [Candidatus Syntrophonatronum acetioxidans]|uniref:Iron-sulfur cluster carrier protein n=1 Tax=Candidatus Syntrophonatronum acetioxidans TaxID=1795816 RepID=A0A424YIR1_9FIRM|nr:MAG: ATP-binding protein [Candidatus Syntrophonatronum acetioxidans]
MEPVFSTSSQEGEVKSKEIDKVIAVMSGKGGVGKSSVTGILALLLARRGYRVGIMDADITGPSIPKIFGIKNRIKPSAEGILPAESSSGLKIVSINLFLDQEDDPVIWRGPLIAGAVKQFWEDVAWGELDYLLVDLPPGTSDAPMTVMKSLPLDGIVVVSSPQDLALLVVKKAVKMAKMLSKPVLGLIENMSYISCPHCQEKIEVFGPSHAREASRELDIPLLGTLPLDLEFSGLCDNGALEEFHKDVDIDLDLILNKWENEG